MKCSEPRKFLMLALSNYGLFTEGVNVSKLILMAATVYFMCCLPTAILADDIDAAANEEFRAYIVSPADGDVVSSPVRVIFGLRSPLGVAPAGVQKDNTGHHHLIIDRPLPPLDQPIPNDEYHKHFGGGQTEVEITLTPGEHSLQLLLGNFVHIPHDPPIMSEQIKITVE